MLESPRLLISSSPLFLVSLSLLHLLVALPLAYFLNIWSDEASTLYTTENGLVQTFQSVFADEKQAPLYFLLLSVWREINNSIFFARSFSIIFSLLAINVFYRLARKIFDEKAAAFITAFFALHPFLIWTSLEIRGYSLVILFSVLLLKFWFEASFEPKDAKMKRRNEILYILIAIAALYTNYYLGFLLAGNFAALAFLRKWRTAKSYFLQMLIVGAAILPLLWMLKAQLGSATGDVQNHRTLAEGLRLIWNSSLSFVLPTEIFPPEDITPVSFVRLWLVRLAILVGAFLLIKRRQTIDEKIFAFGAISTLIGAFLLFAYFLLGDIYVEIRHAAVLFAPFILFVALILKEIFPGKKEEVEKRRDGETERRRDGETERRRDGETERRRDAETRNQRLLRNRRFVSPPLLFSLSPLLLLLFAYSIYTLYPQAAKRGDWTRVARFIEQREKPGQPIIVFTVFDALNLPYHYRGVNRILPDEKFFNWGIEGEYGGADSLKPEIDFALSRIPTESAEIWLATGERCQTTKACAPLENFIEANYTIIEEKDFYKERVRLLRKK